MPNITSTQDTLLKKEPLQSNSLGETTFATKAIKANTTIIYDNEIAKKDGHTKLKLSHGQGDWWIFDKHWQGLTSTKAFVPFNMPGDVNLIIERCLHHGLSLTQASYILATTQHETNATYLPVVEAYWLSEAWRKANLWYWPWHG